MPSIIDTMILAVGLDTSKLEAGQKKAVADAKKAEQELIKHGKILEESAKRASEAFERLRDQIIGLYAAFTAGREIKDFIRDITNSDAAMGYLGKRLNMSAAELSAWGGIMRGVGGTAEDAEATFQAITSDFEQLSITGNSQFLPLFRALQIPMQDANFNLRNMSDLMSDLNQHFYGMAKTDPARAFEFGRMMGITPKMMDVLIKAPEQFKKLREEQEKLHHATTEDIEAAQSRQRAWDNLMTTADNLGRIILTNLTPAIDGFLEALTGISEWFNNNPLLIEAAFTAITALAGLLTIAISKRLIGEALEPLIGVFKIMAKVGRWAFATEVAAGAAEATTAVAGVGAGLAGLASGLAILTGIAAAIVAIGVAAYEFYQHWKDIKAFFGFGEKEKPKDWTEATAEIGNPNAPASVPAAASKSDLETLMGFGWSRDQAIGILANVQRESGGNTRAVGDSGSAFGLAQWHPDRQAAFARWAGHDIRSSTREEQLGFINYELRQGSRRRAGQLLAGSGSAQSAAQVVSRYYESPANANFEAAKRASMAAAMASMPNSSFALASGGAGLGPSMTGGNRSVTSTTSIGQIVINSQATDAAGIAQDIKPVLERQSFVSGIDSGPS